MHSSFRNAESDRLQRTRTRDAKFEDEQACQRGPQVRRRMGGIKQTRHNSWRSRTRRQSMACPHTLREVHELLDALAGALADAAVTGSQDRVVPAQLDLLFGTLAALRANRPAVWWHAVCRSIQKHPLLRRLCDDPITRHALTKPRGYPGDAALLDLLYGLATPLSPTPSGQAIMRYIYNTPTARGVRQRLAVLKTLARQMATQRAGPTTLWSVAAGHLREAEALLPAGCRFVAVDQDATSVDSIARRFANRDVTAHVARVRDIIAGAAPPGCEIHLAYAMGLLDYLDDATASQLLAQMVATLGARGTILVANIAADSPDLGYMEAVMDWRLRARSATQLRALLPPQIRARMSHLRVFRDPSRTFHCLHGRLR